MEILGSRVFTEQDQERFAFFSGDCNPMHMDALAARRTQAGAPVVHGIHLLLWMLDALAQLRPELPPVRKLRAQFNKFVYVNEAAELLLTQEKPNSVRAIASVDGIARSKFNIEFGESTVNYPDWAGASLGEIACSAEPLDVDFMEMSSKQGRLKFQMTPEQADEMFPAAARWLGVGRIQALAASTHLVGMIFPGLHSIYSDLAVSSCIGGPVEDSLSFKVLDADARFRTVDHEIAGGGLTGLVNCVARMPPVAQVSMQELLGIVQAAEFAGSLALIVGGSRGLGELTAKLIAAGGGHVVVTWQSGSADAERVAREICAGGGTCTTLRYDARQPSAEQLTSLTDVPTQMYYFATPTIFKPQSDIFVVDRLAELLEIYVEGFWDLIQTLRAKQPSLSVFYPSSVAVQDRPPGMTEYAMAKAAGEALCVDINLSFAPLHVTQSRLPRLATDQTATVADVETANSLEIMLPIVREVQSWPKRLPSAVKQII